jgi:phage terminase large subunit-like protein
VPFFGAFDVAWDEAMVARCSANPLGMLGPELGARMAANVAVAQDPAGNLKPAKDKSMERIDGIVATIMAIGRALVAHEEPQPEYSLFFV